MELAETVLVAAFSPPGDGPCTVGEMADAVDDEQRLAVDPDVAVVAQRRQEVVVERVLPACGVRLIDQDVPVETVPAPGPGFVGPAQSEWELDSRVGQQVARGVSSRERPSNQ